MEPTGVLESRSVTVPDEIDSPLAKLVYLYLEAAGRASIEDLQRDLDLRRIELHPVLERLADMDLVDADRDRYVAA